MSPARVGIALVTRNSMPFLHETLDSIEPQLASVSAVQVVDDQSQDGTGDLLTEWIASLRTRGIDAQLQSSTSLAEDPRTRTAHNFMHAARALHSVDVIALGDHDDRWLPDRLAHQTAMMQEHPELLFLAGNGILSDASGTLFDAFEVPEDIHTWPCDRIARQVIRRSIATGSASMIRRALLEHPATMPPPGWLHDRWWSVVAASWCGLGVDQQPVIEYRVSPDQQVGLDRGRQRATGIGRLRRARLADLRSIHRLHGLKASAAPEVSALFAYEGLMGNLAR